MDGDLHLIRWAVKQPRRLDQLEPLVHERRGVDGVLDPRPVRVVERFIDADVSQRAAICASASACGEPELVDGGVLLALRH